LSNSKFKHIRALYGLIPKKKLGKDKKLRLYMWKGINMKRSSTCGVGDRGAASTGNTELAWVANLYNATEPSHCSFTLPDSKSPNNKSNPV
jgi:hypothetical protein